MINVFLVAAPTAIVVFAAGYLLGRSASAQRHVDRRLAKETWRPTLDERERP